MAGGPAAGNPLTGGLANIGDSASQQSPARVNMPDPASGGPNALVPPGSGPDNTTSPANRTPGGRRGPLDEVDAQHDYAKSVYDTITKARTMLEHMRREMDGLTRMGDTITPNDVIQAAGRVVSHGVNAHELAGIMVDMPTQSGQGLAAWVAQQDALIQQQEVHTEMIQSIARQKMGVAAIRAIAGSQLRQSARRQARASGPLAPTARPTAGPPGQAPVTNVLETEQAPGMEGPAASEAV
jgi:hypothetical protein